MAQPNEQPVELPLVWIDPDSTEILFVNQVLVQRQNDEYILTFGQQTPPVVSGSPDERLEQLKKIPYVPVRVAVRVGLTTQRLREFLDLVNGLLGQQGEPK